MLSGNRLDGELHLHFNASHTQYNIILHDKKLVHFLNCKFALRNSITLGLIFIIKQDGELDISTLASYKETVPITGGCPKLPQQTFSLEAGPEFVGDVFAIPISK